jgi:Uma2 family endonuclease
MIGVRDPQGEDIRLPRSWVRWPIELRPPPGFDPEQSATWPEVDGRLEYHDGRLLYMAPCGDTQQDVASDVIFVLRGWAEEYPEFIVAANEAGMLLGGEVRGADAAVWRRADLGQHTGGFRRVPPCLAVEIAGREEDEAMLRDKARWYLEHGVAVVWIVLPREREVLHLTSGQEHRARAGEMLPEGGGLPGLTPRIDRFFTQL